MHKILHHFLCISLFGFALQASAAEPLNLSTATLKSTETITTLYGNLQPEHNYPKDKSSAMLFDITSVHVGHSPYRLCKLEK